METINYVEVPADKSQDFNQQKTAWKNGRYVSIDEGPAVTLYIGHREEKMWNEEGEERTIVKAFPVRVQKPVTREKAINAALASAYALSGAEGMASFSASMSRKYRENVNDLDVKEHDAFVSWLKEELSKIGFGGPSTPHVDDSEPTLSEVFGLLKSKIQSFGLGEKEAVAFKRFYPMWTDGINVSKGDRYRVGDKLYECDQEHHTQDNWKPGQGAHSIWHEVTDSHDGTADDPIPYNEEHDTMFPGMILEVGKYYRQDGVTYRCTTNSVIALVQDLSALVGLYVERV